MPQVYRHTPTQQRGQRRVEQILRHAEATFAEVGYDAANTNMIAERAGISIGSLYQFFANKDQILEAMAGRYLAQTLAALQERIDTDTTADPEAFIEDMLALLVKLQERRPYFLQCLGSSRPSPVLNKPIDELNEVVTAHVVKLLRRWGSTEPAARLAVQARVCVETMSALLPMVVYARGRQRQIAATEIRRLLVGYILGLNQPTGQTKSV